VRHCESHWIYNLIITHGVRRGIANWDSDSKILDALDLHFDHHTRISINRLEKIGMEFHQVFFQCQESRAAYVIQGILSVRILISIYFG
jgi:hypothetical protein